MSIVTLEDVLSKVDRPGASVRVEGTADLELPDCVCGAILADEGLVGDEGICVSRSI